MIANLGQSKLRAEQVVAIRVKELKDRAEEHLGQEVKKVLASVPALFNSNRR